MSQLSLEKSVSLGLKPFFILKESQSKERTKRSLMKLATMILEAAESKWPKSEK